VSIELPAIDNSLVVEAKFEGSVMAVRFSGTADSETTGDLERVVEKLHSEAQRLGAKKVTANFRDLEFMNSSSFKVLVTWLADVRELDAAHQYRIHIQSNPEHHWQSRSLEALRCFAVDLVSIET
jgi:anti-anti-sigma factor